MIAKFHQAVHDANALHCSQNGTQGFNVGLNTNMSTEWRKFFMTQVWNFLKELVHVRFINTSQSNNRSDRHYLFWWLEEKLLIFRRKLNFEQFFAKDRNNRSNEKKSKVSYLCTETLVFQIPCGKKEPKEIQRLSFLISGKSEQLSVTCIDINYIITINNWEEYALSVYHSTTYSTNYMYTR